MNEADLQKIKEALEQPTLSKKCEAMRKVLWNMGWRAPIPEITSYVAGEVTDLVSRNMKEIA